MKILQKICFVLLLGAFSSVYGQGFCWGDECKVKAEQGVSWAQYKLGWMYFIGAGGVIQNHKEAAKWYRLAAEQGDSSAQYELGGMYRKGQGVLQHYKEAVKWYRLAAEQGHSSAQYELGRMLHNGQGVLQDYKEAVKWYRKAGRSEALYALGSMYDKGQGVIQDFVMAHMYWNIVAVDGYIKDAIKNRDIVEKKMTASQIEKAQKLTREWMRTHQQIWFEQ